MKTNEIPVGGMADQGIASQPPASPDQTEGVFDINVALENLGGDEQFMGEAVASILIELPVLMARIRGAVDQRDHQALQVETHTLKSVVALIGACDASYAAAKLEFAEADDDAESMLELHTDLERRIELLLDTLQNTFGEASNSPANC